MHIRLALRAYEELGRIQGWGSQSRYYFDAPSTALAILARNGSSLGVPSSGTDDSEANLGETKSSNRLMSGIAGHDGYGWVPKGPDSIYVSCLAYVALGRNTTTHSSVHAWILGSDPQVRDGEQETNGSFNDSLRDTSAVLLWLPIDGSDKTEAVEYLEGEQSPNGSWQGDPYLTGLCVEALKASQE